MTGTPGSGCQGQRLRCRHSDTVPVTSRCLGTEPSSATRPCPRPVLHLTACHRSPPCRQLASRALLRPGVHAKALHPAWTCRRPSSSSCERHTCGPPPSGVHSLPPRSPELPFVPGPPGLGVTGATGRPVLRIGRASAGTTPRRRSARGGPSAVPAAWACSTPAASPGPLPRPREPSHPRAIPPRLISRARVGAKLGVTHEHLLLHGGQARTWR